MTVRVDHHVHVVRRVERARVPVERRLVEAPGRRVAQPERPRDLASMRRQPRASTLGLEVVLIPEPRLDHGRQRSRRIGDVLDQIAVDRDQPGASLRPERGDHAGGPTTPVVPCEHGVLEPQRVQQVDHVDAERALLAGARRRGFEEVGGAVAAQVGHDHPSAADGEQRRHLGVAVDGVREAVQEQHWSAVARSDFVVPDVEDARSDLSDRRESTFGSRRSVAARVRGARERHVCRDETGGGRHEEISSALPRGWRHRSVAPAAPAPVIGCPR